MTDELVKRNVRLGMLLRVAEARNVELLERVRMLLLELGRAVCGVPPEVAYCTLCGQVLVCTARMEDYRDYREVRP
jgi:hypothetical protein